MDNVAVGLIFPHQLFEKNLLATGDYKLYLVEEALFFRQYKFHKIKLAFHRASMKFYQNYLESDGMEVEYINANEKEADIRGRIATTRMSCSIF